MYLAYIAGKYTANDREKKKGYLRQAEEVAIAILKNFPKTIIPIIPHKNTFDFEFEFIDWTSDDWLEKYCFPLLKRCDVLVISNGINENVVEDNSYGVQMEIEFAKENNIPIIYVKNNPNWIKELEDLISIEF